MRSHERAGTRGPGVLAALALVFLQFACTPPAFPLPYPLQPPDPGAIGPYPELAVHVVEHANRTRSAEGARELRGHGALHRAAQDYADELAQRGSLGHTSPTPGRRTMTDRLHAAGARYRSAGENLAKLASKPKRVGEGTVYMWMRSDGHRQNLLGRSYTHTGVGVARDGDGMWYVVQLYMLPADGTL